MSDFIVMHRIGRFNVSERANGVLLVERTDEGHAGEIKAMPTAKMEQVILAVWDKTPWPEMLT